MYRVRYFWDKADSQLDAYNYLYKAIQKAKVVGISYFAGTSKAYFILE